MTFNYPTIRGISRSLKEEEPQTPLTVEDAAKIIDMLAAKIEKLEKQVKDRR
jgi:hypothetical protein